jgi:Ca2+-binding EF-hand superfamily protein
MSADPKAAFQVFDVDNDGYITHDELKHMLRILGCAVSDKEAEEMGAQCQDPDHISFEEVQYLAANSPKPERASEQEILDAFRVFDNDENGLLRENEVRTIFTTLGEPLTMDEINSLLTAMKPDEFGRLKYADFIKSFLQMK